MVRTVGGVQVWAAVAVLVQWWSSGCWAARETGRHGAQKAGGRAKDGGEGSGACRFPADWRAAYFLGGTREPFTVTGQVGLE